MYARGTERYPNTVVAFCLFNYQTAHFRVPTFRIFFIFVIFSHKNWFNDKSGYGFISWSTQNVIFTILQIHISYEVCHTFILPLSLSLSLSPPRSHTFLKLSDHIIKTIETQMYFQLLILIFREIVFHLYMVG